MYLGELGELAGKRVEAYLAQKGAELQAAWRKAESPDATLEDVERAEKLKAAYDIEIKNYEAAAKKKAKSFVSQLKTLHEKKIKLLGKISPTEHAHAQHIERIEKADKLKLQAMKLQGQKPSAARDAELTSINQQLTKIGKSEKVYMRQGVVVATVASIIVGIFTFGGGTAAIQGAVQAIKQGAIQAMRAILVAAIGSAVAKGASKKDADQAMSTVDVMSQYPPDPNLTTFDQMVQDSYLKKAIAEGKLDPTDTTKPPPIPPAAWLIPAGIGIAALFML
jgi:hypothetical protein